MYLWELEKVDQTSGGASLYSAAHSGSAFLHMGATEVRGLLISFFWTRFYCTNDVA